jgi:Calx-beta domain-containing protein
MKSMIRAALIVITGVASALVPAAAAQANSHVTVTLTGTPAGGYEFLKGCTNTAPYSCYTRNGALPFDITVSNLNSPITVGYATQDGTAVSGEDYQATSGTVTIQPNFPQAFLSVPLVNDGEAPGTSEQFSVVITSVTQGTVQGSPAPMVIDNGGNVPADCNFARSDAVTVSLTCTSRPATQQWHINVVCKGSTEWNFQTIFGNTVTGDGTSSGTCNSTQTAINEGYQAVS